MIRITLCISQVIYYMSYRTLIRMERLHSLLRRNESPHYMYMKPEDGEMLLVKVEKLEFSGIIVLEKKHKHV